MHEAQRMNQEHVILYLKGSIHCPRMADGILQCPDGSLIAVVGELIDADDACNHTYLFLSLRVVNLQRHHIFNCLLCLLDVEVCSRCLS